MNISKKEIIIGGGFCLALLILPPPLFLGMLLCYFIWFIYKNYKWKR